MTDESLEALKTQAKELGIPILGNFSATTLRQRIADKLASQEPRKEAPVAGTEAGNSEANQTGEETVMAEAGAVPVAGQQAPKPLKGGKEGPDAKRRRLFKEQMRLRRVIIHCNDDNKRDWQGEYLKIGNNVIGTYTKFVPFDLDAGYHLPQCMLDHMEDCMCQKFRNVRRKEDGEIIKVPYMTKAYNITYLPDLKKDELRELADDQRARNAIDEGEIV
jgi:hypothetical protein